MACVQADAFPLAFAAQPELDEQLRALFRACAATEAPDVLRPALDDLSWSLLDATLTEVAQPVLARTAQLATRHQATLTAEHQRCGPRSTGSRMYPQAAARTGTTGLARDPHFLLRSVWTAPAARGNAPMLQASRPVQLRAGARQPPRGWADRGPGSNETSDGPSPG